jgi:hypothetical protein
VSVRHLLSRRRARLAAAAGSIAVASTVLAVSVAHGAPDPSVVKGSGDLTGSILDCSTDTVTLTGTYRYTETGFVNQLPDGRWFSHGTLSFNLKGVVGTGASGTSYRVMGATHLGYSFFFGSASPGIDVEHSTETWNLAPSGGGRPLTFRENFGFVVTPSGSTTLVDHGSGDCS